MSLFVSFHSISCTSPSPIQTEGKENWNFPPYWFKPRWEEILYASSGWGNCASCPTVIFLVWIPPVRCFRCCGVVDHLWSLLHIPPLPLFACVASGAFHAVMPPSLYAASFLGLTRPLVAPCCNTLGGSRPTGLLLFFQSASGTMTVSCGVLAPWIGRLSVTVCLALTLPTEDGTLEGTRSACSMGNNNKRFVKFQLPLSSIMRLHLELASLFHFMYVTTMM